MSEEKRDLSRKRIFKISIQVPGEESSELIVASDNGILVEEWIKNEKIADDSTFNETDLSPEDFKEDEIDLILPESVEEEKQEKLYEQLMRAGWTKTSSVKIMTINGDTIYNDEDNDEESWVRISHGVIDIKFIKGEESTGSRTIQAPIYDVVTDTPFYKKMQERATSDRNI